MGKATPWTKRSGSFKVNEFVKQRGNIVTNGDMLYTGSNGVANGWIKKVGLTGAWSIVTGNGFVGNAQRYVNGSDNYSGVYQTYANFKVGIRVKVRFKYRTNSDNMYVSIANALSTTPGTIPINTNNAIYYEYITTCTVNSNLVYAQFLSGDVGDWFEISEYSITELDPLPTITTGTKYLECVTTGVIALPSKWAYGTVEFDVYRDALSLTNFSIISNNNKADYDTLYNQYSLLLWSNTRNIRLLYNSNTKFISEQIVEVATWYGVKVTRSKVGEFTTYMRGGSLGNNWIKISAVSGTNPITDNNVNTSNYFVAAMRAGDRIANLQMYNEVI